jgi:hypothetical protein
MIRIQALRPLRVSRLSFSLAAVLGLCAPAGLMGVAGAQEPETTYGAYGTFGYSQGVSGGCSSCGTCNTCGQQCNTCQTHHCPPKLEHCMEGEPKIHVKIGCPKPICNPCSQPNWGYYDKCWNPWPYPPNWTHCPNPPPAATVALAERTYGGLTPFYGPETVPTVTSTPRSYVSPTPAQPSYMPPQPMPPSMSPPIRTTPTPMPSQVPTPMPSTSSPGFPGIPGSPLESLPIPRQQETLRPTPGNLDDF